jgi:hypothetical protein
MVGSGEGKKPYLPSRKEMTPNHEITTELYLGI